MRKVSISSRQNEQVKQCLKLHTKKGRELFSKFIVEGSREIDRALRSTKVKPLAIWYTNECKKDALGFIKRFPGLELIEATPSVIEKISYRKNAEGLLLIASMEIPALSDLKLKETPLLLVVEGIEKPGNLGAFMRTAESVGADALIVCNSTTDLFNPNVIRASTGTLFSLPIYNASTDETLDFLKTNKVLSIATTPPSQNPYWDMDLRKSVAVWIGSEKSGLSPTALKSISTQVTIPQQGQADSLNAHTAASIILYEALRQRTGNTCSEIHT